MLLAASSIAFHLVSNGPHKWLSPLTRRPKISLALAACMLPLLAPFFTANRALYFFNAGPDLGGHMIGSGVIADGKTYPELTSLFGQITGGKLFDLTVSHWGAPDFRDAIAIEFPLYTMRIAPGLVLGTIEEIVSAPRAEIFLAMALYFVSLASFATFTLLRKFGNGTIAAVALTCAIFLSSNWLMVSYEGVTGHIFVTVFILRLLDVAHSSLARGRSLLGFIFCGLHFTAIMLSMAEALYIIAVFSAVAILVSPIISRFVQPNLNIKEIAWSTFTMLTGIILAVPFLPHFVRLQRMRLSQGLDYTGFGDFDWSLEAVIFSGAFLRSSKVDRMVELSVTASPQRNLAILGILAAVFVITFIRRRSDMMVLLGVVACATATAFLIFGTRYALWKATAIMQPLFIGATWSALRSGLRFRHLETVLALSLACGVCVAGVLTVTEYRDTAIHLRNENFLLDNGDENEIATVLVTPQPHTVYHFLAVNHPFYYANSGWGPKLGNLDGPLRVGLLFDCRLEGRIPCDLLVDAGFAPNYVNPIVGQSLPYLSDGRIDLSKLGMYLEKVIPSESIGSVYSESRTE